MPDAKFAVGLSISEDRLRLVAADLRLQELSTEGCTTPW